MPQFVSSQVELTPKEKVSKFFRNLTSRRTLSLLGILFVVLALPVTIFVLQQQQTIQQRASETTYEINSINLDIQEVKKQTENLNNLLVVYRSTINLTKKQDIYKEIKTTISERKKIMLKLMEKNTQEFINLALSETERQNIPIELQSEIEGKIIIEGTYDESHVDVWGRNNPDNFRIIKTKDNNYLSLYLTDSVLYNLHGVTVKISGTKLDKSIAVLNTNNNFQIISTNKIANKINSPNVQDMPPLPLNMPVLVLGYFPPDPLATESAIEDRHLDPNETGWGPRNYGEKTIAEWHSLMNKQVEKGVNLINDASKFHGYKNVNADQFLNYFALDTKIFYTPIPPTDFPIADPQHPEYKFYDNVNILKNLNICDYVNNQGVKEVWIYGYHNDKPVTGIVGKIPVESILSSNYGNVANSYIEWSLPSCNSSYTVYDFTYTPDGGIANNLHNRIHQIEMIIPFNENKWHEINSSNCLDKMGTYWGDFSESQACYNLKDRQTWKSTCGSAHYTPNWATRDDMYHYDKRATEDHPEYRRDYDCEDWNPNANKTKYINDDCQKWGCTDFGFYKWFMQNMPGYENGISYKGKVMRNWWEAFYDFNTFTDLSYFQKGGPSLYGDSIFNKPPIPTPHKIDLETSRAYLKADDFYIIINDKKFVAENSTITVIKDPNKWYGSKNWDKNTTGIGATWNENGDEIKLLLTISKNEDLSKWLFSFTTTFKKTHSSVYRSETNQILIPIGQPYTSELYHRVAYDLKGTNKYYNTIHFKNLNIGAFLKQPSPSPTPTFTPTPTPDPNATPTPIPNKITWRTSFTNLDADNFYMVLNGRQYLANPNTVNVHSENLGSYLKLEVSWHENDADILLRIWFQKDSDTDWSAQTWETYENGARKDYYNPEIKGKIGNPFTTDSLVLTTYDKTGEIHFEKIKLQPFF